MLHDLLGANSLHIWVMLLSLSFSQSLSLSIYLSLSLSLYRFIYLFLSSLSLSLSLYIYIYIYIYLYIYNTRQKKERGHWLIRNEFIMWLGKKTHTHTQIYIFIYHQIVLITRSSLTISILPYRPLLLEGSLEWIQRPHRTVVCKSACLVFLLGCLISKSLYICCFVRCCRFILSEIRFPYDWKPVKCCPHLTYAYVGVSSWCNG